MSKVLLSTIFTRAFVKQVKIRCVSHKTPLRANTKEKLKKKKQKKLPHLTEANVKYSV